MVLLLLAIVVAGAAVTSYFRNEIPCADILDLLDEGLGANTR